MVITAQYTASKKPFILSLLPSPSNIYITVEAKKTINPKNIKSVKNSNFFSTKTLSRKFTLCVYLKTLKSLNNKKNLRTLRGLYDGKIAKRSMIDIGDITKSNLLFNASLKSTPKVTSLLSCSNFS